jgi:hypothetical protein
MSAEVSAADPTTPPGPYPAGADRRSRITYLLGLVSRLIEHGRQLATALRQRGVPNVPALSTCCFGTRDIALILSRIALGVQRAGALEARLLRSTARPDPKPRTPRAPAPRVPRTPQPAKESAEIDPALARLPTPEQIAAEIRHRPIGTVIAHICHDLGIMPQHPMWRELQVAVILHGGSLVDFVKSVRSRASVVLSECFSGAPALPLPFMSPSPAPASTGPP